MTIIEAIKSGKRFRRPKFNYWFSIVDEKIIDEDGEWQFKNVLSDLLADDWEIEEEKIELTRSQLEAAWNYMFKEDNARDVHASLYKTAFPLLADRLGFK